jgi:hypothetical protein
MRLHPVLVLAGLAVLVLVSMRRAEAGLPVPPAARFPDQADSPFGESETGGGLPQVIF